MQHVSATQNFTLWLQKPSRGSATTSSAATTAGAAFGSILPYLYFLPHCSLTHSLLSFSLSLGISLPAAADTAAVFSVCPSVQLCNSGSHCSTLYPNRVRPGAAEVHHLRRPSQRLKEHWQIRIQVLGPWVSGSWVQVLGAIRPSHGSPVRCR